MSENRVEYLFLGDELGGRSKNTSCYNDKGQLQYHLLSKDLLFKKGLKKVTEEIKRHNVVLMCSEADPLKCHRTILVCRQLYHAMNIPKNRIQHILSNGSVQSHIEIEKKLLDSLKIAPDMLRDETECIETAYIKQAQKIAYTSKNDLNFLGESRQRVSFFENKHI